MPLISSESLFHYGAPTAKALVPHVTVLGAVGTAGNVSAEERRASLD